MKKILFLLLILVLLGSSPAAAAPDQADDVEGRARAVLERVTPSLVKVIAENGKRYVASGIALGGGLVVTSTLVTKRPFASIGVETAKGEFIAARVAGQEDRSGLTLLRLERKGPPPLSEAAAPEVGSWVALVGLFYDKFPAISQGIVSSLGENELIVNAPVAPGSSGGAVVDRDGRLVGVIRGSVGFSFTPDLTFKDHSTTIVVSGSRSQGNSLCYAIPAAQVRRTADKLLRDGRIAPGWMGAIFVEATNEVQGIYKSSPAAKAGILRGDRIVKLAGRPVADWQEIVSALAFRFAGDTIDVTVNRGGKALPLAVVLAERRLPAPPEPPKPVPVPELADFPGLAERLAELPDLSELDSTLPQVRHYVIELGGARQLGVDVMEITADLGRKFAVKEGYGLLVSSVMPGSAAATAGLKAGDVMVRANESPLRTTNDLRRALGALKDKESVLLVLYRDGQQRRFSIVPDRGGKLAWDIRRFSQKVGELQDNASDETRAMLLEELRKLKQLRETEFAEQQKDRQLLLRKAREESRMLVRELQRLQAEKDRLSDAAQQGYAAKLQAIQQELRRIEEMIKAEEKGKGGN
jgi:S1-C subfamily serine protease